MWKHLLHVRSHKHGHQLTLTKDEASTQQKPPYPGDGRFGGIEVIWELNQKDTHTTDPSRVVDVEHEGRKQHYPTVACVREILVGHLYNDPSVLKITWSPIPGHNKIIINDYQDK